MRTPIGGTATRQRLLLAALAVVALAGCWRLATAWYEDTHVAHDFIQDYASV